MEVKISLVSPAERKPKIEPAKLGFGRYFTDHMFAASYDPQKGWHDPEIKKYENISLDPAAIVLHYAQEVFEGLKAFPRPGGRVATFRAKDNIRRMNGSCRRLVMPELDPGFHLQAIETLLDIEREWVPQAEGAALYIRPTMIATEPQLGVRPANYYLFYIILSPVGPYFPRGFSPVRLLASTEYVRAVKGGIGAAKTGGNYAASLLALKEAKDRGYDQNLWLDAFELKYAEEMGGMNAWFVFGKTLATAPLTGTILPGVTRDSIITLARERGYTVEERRISIGEIIEGALSGKLTEAFASGTAAVVTAIGEIGHQGKDVRIADGQPGKITTELYQTLTGIHYGTIEDTHGWIRIAPIVEM